MLIRSQHTGAKTVPAVSIVMWRPAALNASVKGTISGAIMGSPPVTTTCFDRYCATCSTRDATDRSLPSGCHDVYGVSHQTQRRLQPEVRTKTEGTPRSEPSPWME